MGFLYLVVALVQFVPALMYYAIGNYWLAAIWCLVTIMWGMLAGIKLLRWW